MAVSPSTGGGGRGRALECAMKAPVRHDGVGGGQAAGGGWEGAEEEFSPREGFHGALLKQQF